MLLNLPTDRLVVQRSWRVLISRVEGDCESFSSAWFFIWRLQHGPSMVVLVTGLVIVELVVFIIRVTSTTTASATSVCVFDSIVALCRVLSHDRAVLDIRRMAYGPPP